MTNGPPAVSVVMPVRNGATYLELAVRSVLEQTFSDFEFIIIDDGSHHCTDVVKTFGLLFDRLAPLGKYFIEDLHCSYYPDFGGGLRSDGSSIEFLKKLIDALHFDHISGDQLPDPALRDSMKAYNQWIARTTFYDSLCIVEKTGFAKEHPYRSRLST